MIPWLYRLFSEPKPKTWDSYGGRPINPDPTRGPWSEDSAPERLLPASPEEVSAIRLLADRVHEAIENLLKKH